MAKCFEQKQGIYYLPVAMLIHVRIMLAAYHDYEIWQMDMKTVFPKGYLEEEVYMS